jgi:hypothetical protein
MGGKKGRTGKYIKTDIHKENLSKSLTGHLVSDETRRKISNANRGKKFDAEVVKLRNLKISGSNSGKFFDKKRRDSYKTYWESKKGKTLSDETKKKLSNARKGKHHSEETLRKLSGENSPLWKGGISYKEYPKEFNNTLKNEIRKRDNNACQICKSASKSKLCIHHIDYNKKNNVSTNLISLCRRCHGLTNHNRERWQAFFSNQRQYLPTFADLIDRLGICMLKYVFISEHSNEYYLEMKTILHDIELLINKDKIYINSTMIYAIMANILCNRYIWENESKARQGGSEQDKLLKLTHSINGIRNTAKNVISQERGERVDLKIDALAAELVEEFGNWNLFEKE